MSFGKHALKKLNSKNFKTTKARTTIINILSKSKKSLNPYQVSKVLDNKIDVTTIYRNLEIFEKLGIVHKINSTDGYIRCTKKGKHHCHHYIVCKKCNIVQEIKNKNHKHKIPKQFIETENIFESQGICKKCR